MAIATEMYCDACGETIHRSKAISKTTMELLAKVDGWSVGKYHLCPECKAKGVKRLKKEGWLH